MDESTALPILARYTEGLDTAARGALLDETAVTLTVNGAPVTLYDPYAAAVAHLMHPDQLKARSEGEVSETYVDHGQVISYLERKSAELRASWPLDDATATIKPNLELTFGGW